MTDVDAELPKAAIKRIIKCKLTETGLDGASKCDVQVSKEALAAFTQATKVFISYVASAAHDVCIESKRATVVPKDVMQALADLSFGEFVPQLAELLHGVICSACLDSFRELD
jgi:DNA polymerase epsilon subunit 3